MVVFGDFNSVLNPSEKRNELMDRERDVKDLRKFVGNCSLFDIEASGCQFTWNNNHMILEDRIWCKLDRVMAITDWIDQFPEASAVFLPPGISDHSPAVLCWCSSPIRKSSFRYCNFWELFEDYHEKVADYWRGTNMFLFQAELKEMKQMMKTEFVNVTKGIDKRIGNLRTSLGKAQISSEDNPSEVTLSYNEQSLAKEYRKERAKMSWLKEGDANTKYFHGVLKGRRSQNSIKFVKCSDGSISSDPQIIKSEFVSYFKSILAQSKDCVSIKYEVVNRGKKVENQCRGLIKEASDREIWDALRKIRGTNSAYIALISKTNVAGEPRDYRPISCCNVSYKVISGILPERLKVIIPDLIDFAQGAFIQGRSFVGNICLAQQLVAGYGRRNISERLAWKIDLRKAYDSIDWNFLRINGEMVDFFARKRGLRQGNPISQLLFTIAMEYLSRSLKGITRVSGFYHHPKCHRIDLKHIIFADNLFLLSNGRSSSILALKAALDDFLQCSGLSVNIDKSQVFITGMTEDKRSWTENLLRTRISVLPVRYLGFPLTSRYISAHNCPVIIHRITKMLGFWSNRFLSRAGRRVLIQSVLQAIVFCWARICILSKTVLKTINAICARFLWNGCSTGRGIHLLSWDTACLDKREDKTRIFGIDGLERTGRKEATGGRTMSSSTALGCCALGYVQTPQFQDLSGYLWGGFEVFEGVWGANFMASSHSLV
ncbi:hypothetical protein QQ045_005025 [Rhodiola kirilowii]